MTQNATSAAQGCIFCAIVARQAEASVVYADETVVVFMDLNPVTPGHLLVVPREHAVASKTSMEPLALTFGRSVMTWHEPCTVFHFHLHVIPRYAGDGWTLKAESPERERSLLDSEAQAIKDAIAPGTPASSTPVPAS
ncbi:MAG TPA: HIT family protein [Nocardioidaceae bacterium]|nr:HIT family protein [Nocardioidaceae bacterium]